jgi:hypothetical protein
MTSTAPEGKPRFAADSWSSYWFRLKSKNSLELPHETSEKKTILLGCLSSICPQAAVGWIQFRRNRRTFSTWKYSRLSRRTRVSLTISSFWLSGPIFLPYVRTRIRFSAPPASPDGQMCRHGLFVTALSHLSEIHARLRLFSQLRMN